MDVTNCMIGETVLKKTLCVLIFALLLVVSMPALAANEAKIGSQEYASFADAVTAANGMSGSVEIELLSDVRQSGTYTITGDVTVKGNHTIYREMGATTLFTVKAGAKLTLTGGVIIDGNNDWVFDSATYYADLPDNNFRGDTYSYATSEAGGTKSTKKMFDISGEVKLLNATVQNTFASGGKSATVFYVNAGGVLTMDNGFTATHNYMKGDAGLVASWGTWTMKDGATIEYTHAESGLGGVGHLNTDSVFNLEGGLVRNNTAFSTLNNGNGIFIVMYTGVDTVTFSGGTIKNNAGFGNGGWGSIVYIHANCKGKFEMTGGLIEDNQSEYCTGIAGDGQQATCLLTGGTIKQPMPGNGGYASLTACETFVIGEDMTISGAPLRLHSYSASKEYAPVINGTVDADLQISTGKFTVTGGGTVKGNLDLRSTAKVSISDGRWEGKLIVPDSATLEISGGTFLDDPTPYLADGFVAVKHGGRYGVYDEQTAATIVPDTGDNAPIFLWCALALIATICLAAKRKAYR